MSQPYWVEVDIEAEVDNETEVDNEAEVDLKLRLKWGWDGDESKFTRNWVGDEISKCWIKEEIRLS